MGDHGGQMPKGTLDVKEFFVTEPINADEPAQAIPQAGEFTLHAKFSGTGTEWNNINAAMHEFEILFHLEGIGATEDETEFGPTKMKLDGSSEYEATYLVTADKNTLKPGLYRCGVTIVDTNWPGAVGYYEGLIIQIY